MSRRHVHAMALLAVAAVALAAPVVTAGGGVTVAPAADATVDVGNDATVTLVATDVADADGVGAFDVSVSFDPAVVTVSASGTGEFDVATDRPDDGRLSVVGYTGSDPGPTGDVALASLAVTGNDVGSASIDVAVETLADAEGDDLAANGGTASVTVEADDDGNGGGGVPDDPDDGDDDDRNEERDGATTTPAAATATPTTAPSDETATPADATVGESTATATEPPESPGGGAAPLPGPGFGPLAALVALVATALVLARRR